MSDNTYNGWSNFETWQAGLWLNESDFLGNCQECEFTEITPEMVEDELYLIAGAEDLKGLASDIFNSWVSCVNMHELVDHFNKDMEAY